ncbi:MAG: amidohydrolase family protein [Parcubacteria group bacterium]|nr:amidohydrolase family protein [Parcubacteria group bacterium]
MESWNLKKQLLEEIKSKGGFVNCHGHFDKAFYITRGGLDKSMLDMEEKWLMSDDIKKESTEEEVMNRIRRVLDILIAQGCKNTCSFIDAYSAVGHKNIDAAIKVQEEYKDKINFKTITQPLGGLIDSKERKIYEEVTAKADIAGGLPSKDRPNDNKNFDYLFSIAKNLGKPIHVHIDQENNPKERDTEKLIKYTKKHGYEGRVIAIHSISVAAQDKKYRQEIYKGLVDSGIGVVVCPLSALGMKQLDQYSAPVHNSIANVPEMIKAGINIALGIDNICDFYCPFNDGDMWAEIRVLQEACRYYDFDQLVNIATTNGINLLNIK